MAATIWKLKYTARAVMDSSKALLHSDLSFENRLQLFTALMQLKWLHAFRKSIAETTVSFLKGKLVLPNHSSSQFILKEIFVTEVYKMKKSFTQPMAVLDLGANIGLSAVYFSTQFPVKKLVCLEPDTHNFGRLQKNLSQLKVPVQLHQAAVGLETKQANSVINGDDPVQRKVVARDGGEMMQFISFESLLQQPFDIVKMDIEGGEWPLLDQLVEKQLLTTACYWMMELHDVQEHATTWAKVQKLCEKEHYTCENYKGIWHLYKA